MADLAPVDPTVTLRLDPEPDPSAEALESAMTHRRFLGEYAERERAAQAARDFTARVLPLTRVLRVRTAADGPEAPGCGTVWLVAEDDDLAVLALMLDDHGHAPAVRELVLDIARSEGFRRLTIGVAPGDPALERFVLGRHFEVTAFQMRLDLDHLLPDQDVVALEPMDQPTYDDFMRAGVEEYAADRARAGETPEHAAEVAEQQMARLLPDGLATAEHHFFCATVGGERVGSLWLGTERPLAFVYDVVVDEAHRRRGYGAGIMRAGARWSQARGAHALGLNVFGFNRGAKQLYDRLGYHVVEELAAHVVERDGA